MLLELNTLILKLVCFFLLKKEQNSLLKSNKKCLQSTHDSINLLLKHREHNNYVVQEIDFESLGDGPLIGLNLSGEEDPWVMQNMPLLIH